ncbi:hypothetical protein NCCNTM_06380 [Mycolicibacterium sp. NCC-Tsukiji]|nr:hypothetical protein NCCNTM_06380 [Mycolicibacterium sp. NCC-Tsukiji]
MVVHGATPFAITVLLTFITPLWTDGKGIQRCGSDEEISNDDREDEPVGRSARRLPLPFAIDVRHNRIENRPAVRQFRTGTGPAKSAHIHTRALTRRNMLFATPTNRLCPTRFGAAGSRSADSIWTVGSRV